MWRRKKHIAKPRKRIGVDATPRSPEQETLRAKRDCGATASLSFEGNPKHLAKLKEGIEAWNKWREENPYIKPDLRRLDFTRTDDFQGTPVWGRPDWDINGPERALLEDANFSRARLTRANLSRAYLPRANFSDAYLMNANLSRAYLTHANLNGAYFKYANLSGANLRKADLSHANLGQVNLSGASLGEVNLSGAKLSRANLSGAILVGANLCGVKLGGANLRGTNLSLTNLSDADVSSVHYDRELLHACCDGIRAETCYGNAQFKRDVMDQDYLDQIIFRILNNEKGKPGSLPEERGWWAMWLYRVAKWPLVGGALGFLLTLILLHNIHDHAHRMAEILAAPTQDWPLTMVLVLGGASLAGVLASTAGRLAIFKLWGLFDYGRSSAAVLVFAAMIIFFVGLGYYAWDGTHIVLSGEAHSHPIWFFPWFVALMGFATLGISSYATPLDSVGALLMMANVLSGFLTLGLLLSVLGNIFARRA